MRIGLFLAYWPWFSPEEQVELAVLADELGLDSVWISEAWGQDAVSVLGLLAGRPSASALGSGLMQIPARQPAATAMAAATLDVLTGGRFRLGLGVSGPQVSEGWYGVPFPRAAAPHARVRGDRAHGPGPRGPLEHDGESGRSRCPRPGQAAQAAGQAGAGAAADLPRRDRPEGGRAGGRDRRRLAAVPARPARAGRRCSTRCARARESAGRSLEEIDIAPVVPVAVDEDLDAARNAVAPWLAFYLGAMGAQGQELLRRARRAPRATATSAREVPGAVPGRRPDGRRRRASPTS